jgi:hypothetical protein
MKKIWPTMILVLVILLMVGIPELDAQCPMCRMSAESNLEHGGTMGKGLNKGILYILSLPYLIVLSLGIIWYRNKKKTSTEDFDVD